MSATVFVNLPLPGGADVGEIVLKRLGWVFLNEKNI